MTPRRGCLWLAAGLLLAILAGIATFVTIQRMMAAARPVEEPPRVQVLVASHDLPLHTLIGKGDVELKPVPPEIVPQAALTDPTQAVGQLTTADISQGEMILRQRLIPPDYLGPRAALVMDPEKVIIAFPATDLLNLIGIIRPGDRVDLMYSFDFGKASPGIEAGVNSFTAIPDLEVAAVVHGPSEQEGQQGPRQAILLAVDPQNALMIKYFRDSGAAPDFALRSPTARGVFDVEPVDGDYILKRFKVRWRVQE